jgi:hypothetical protein
MSKWEEFSKRLDEYYQLRGRKEFGENLSSMSESFDCSSGQYLKQRIKRSYGTSFLLSFSNRQKISR